MKISQELSDKIQQSIYEFVTDSEPFWGLSDESDKKLDLRKIAGEVNFLPVVFDLGGSWGIKPDGEIILVIYSASLKTEIETNQKIINMVLYRTAKTNPELKELMPIRNSSSIICPGCNGSGILKELAFHELLSKAVNCNCGGVGWLPSSEEKYLYF